MKSWKRDPQQPSKTPTLDQPLQTEDIRLISDLRIMHLKVEELYQIVTTVKHRHDAARIPTYADASVLAEDINRIDEIYIWFLSLQEEAVRKACNQQVESEER